jgi:hypothetical protein
MKVRFRVLRQLPPWLRTEVRVTPTFARIPRIDESPVVVFHYVNIEQLGNHVRERFTVHAGQRSSRGNGDHTGLRHARLASNSV